MPYQLPIPPLPITPEQRGKLRPTIDLAFEGHRMRLVQKGEEFMLVANDLIDAFPGTDAKSIIGNLPPSDIWIGHLLHPQRGVQEVDIIGIRTAITVAVLLGDYGEAESRERLYLDWLWDVALPAASREAEGTPEASLPAEEAKLLGIIRRAGVAGITSSAILRASQLMPTERRRQALDALVGFALVEREVTPGHGRPAIIYRAVATPASAAEAA